jgi:hypothetical protein
MAAELATKFPNIKAFTGTCTDGSTTTVTFNTGTQGTFKAKEGAVFYAEPYADSDALLFFRKSDIPRSAQNRTADDVLLDLLDYVIDNDENRLLLEGTPVNMRSSLRGLTHVIVIPKAYKFRLAVITTKEYSNKFGNTRNTVLTEIVRVMARLNGVYLGELGVMFELIADNDDMLICLVGEADCSSTDGDTLFDQTAPFIESRGVASTAYDIGHSFTTGYGGRAVLGALCSSHKEKGTTGRSNPRGDPFYINYVAHEIDHQLLGGHSFRDCGGNITVYSAVEPGSGSSIMAYAVICGENDVQSNSDPWFYSQQLVTMHNFVDQVSCG